MVGAVDLAGGIEHVLIRQQMSPLHDHASAAYLELQPAQQRLVDRAKARVRWCCSAPIQTTQAYATLEAMACAPATAAGVALAARAALQAAGVHPGDVGYIEVSAGGFPIPG